MQSLAPPSQSMTRTRMVTLVWPPLVVVGVMGVWMMTPVPLPPSVGLSMVVALPLHQPMVGGAVVASRLTRMAMT